MSKHRAAQLLSIIGNNFIEIDPPEGGWTKLYTSCVVSRNDEEIGKFFLRQYGDIDYINKSCSMANLVNYHPALLDLAIRQLEEKAAATLKRRADARVFPNLYHLLMRYHGLYY